MNKQAELLSTFYRVHVIPCLRILFFVFACATMSDILPYYFLTDRTKFIDYAFFGDFICGLFAALLFFFRNWRMRQQVDAVTTTRERMAQETQKIEKALALMMQMVETEPKNDADHSISAAQRTLLKRKIREIRSDLGVGMGVLDGGSDTLQQTTNAEK